MQTNQQKTSGLLNRTAQVSKYIVILWKGHEQVVSFPFEVKHADILAYVRQECGEAEAVSAGFFIHEPDAFWCGGESTTLNLKSRPEDRGLVQSFLNSAERRLWDLTLMAQEAASV
jgi:hypothetical protein